MDESALQDEGLADIQDLHYTMKYLSGIGEFKLLETSYHAQDKLGIVTPMTLIGLRLTTNSEDSFQVSSSLRQEWFDQIKNSLYHAGVEIFASHEFIHYVGVGINNYREAAAFIQKVFNCAYEVSKELSSKSSDLQVDPISEFPFKLTARLLEAIPVRTVSGKVDWFGLCDDFGHIASFLQGTGQKKCAVRMEAWIFKRVDGHIKCSENPRDQALEKALDVYLVPRSPLELESFYRFANRNGSDVNELAPTRFFPVVAGILLIDVCNFHFDCHWLS